MMCSITAILVRNRGLGTARFAELAAGAGVRAYGVPSHTPGGCLQILANAGAAKKGPMREFAGIMGWANRRVGALSAERIGLPSQRTFKHCEGFRRLLEVPIGSNES